jgi:uncharacterized membrane protein YfcA
MYSVGVCSLPLVHGATVYLCILYKYCKDTTTTEKEEIRLGLACSRAVDVGGVIPLETEMQLLAGYTGWLACAIVLWLWLGPREGLQRWRLALAPTSPRAAAEEPAAGKARAQRPRRLHLRRHRL